MKPQGDPAQGRRRALRSRRSAKLGNRVGGNRPSMGQLAEPSRNGPNVEPSGGGQTRRKVTRKPERPKMHQHEPTAVA